MSTGGSGGAYTSLQIADAYPGPLRRRGHQRHLPRRAVDLDVATRRQAAQSLPLRQQHHRLHRAADGGRVRGTRTLVPDADLNARNQGAPILSPGGSGDTGDPILEWLCLGGVERRRCRWHCDTPDDQPEGCAPDRLRCRPQHLRRRSATTGFALPLRQRRCQYGLSRAERGAITTTSSSTSTSASVATTRTATTSRLGHRRPRRDQAAPTRAAFSSVARRWPGVDPAVFDLGGI